MKGQMMLVVCPWSKRHGTVLSVEGEFLSINSTSCLKYYRDKPHNATVRIHRSPDILKAFKISIHTVWYDWLKKKTNKQKQKTKNKTKNKKQTNKTKQQQKNGQLCVAWKEDIDNDGDNDDDLSLKQNYQ